MSAIKGLLRGKWSEKSPAATNITKYPVGTRVPRNEDAERIVRNAVAIRPTSLVKSK